MSFNAIITCINNHYLFSEYLTIKERVNNKEVLLNIPVCPFNYECKYQGQFLTLYQKHICDGKLLADREQMEVDKKLNLESII